MRPTKTKQSELLRPLNRILGTEAAVRVLRVLALTQAPLAAGEVAKRAELGRTSIYPALRELESTDVVEYVGVGAQRHVQLRKRHPLSTQIRELFRAEGERYEELLSRLRKLVASAVVRPNAAWIDEDATRRSHSQTLNIQFVASPQDVAAITDYLSGRVSPIEKAFDVPIAFTGFSLSEMEAQYSSSISRLANVVLVDGVPPTALLARASGHKSRRSTRMHGDLDERAKKLALALTLKVRRDPDVVAKATTKIKKRMKQASMGEQRELAEWIRILETMSPARLRKFLLEDSERATRLRQTLPLGLLLTQAERDAVLRSTTEAEVAAALRGM